MRDKRERQRHRQEEKQAPWGEPDVGLDGRTPEIMPWAKDRYLITEHPGTSVPVFDKQNESKEDFHFKWKKRWKTKIAFSVRSAASPWGSTRIQPRCQSGTASLHAGNHTRGLHIQPPWLWTVGISVFYCDLFCASVSKMCPKVSEES